MRITGAVIEKAGGPFVLSDLDLAPPRSDEVVVRIAAVGLCHTDLTIAGGFRGTPFPILLGHEGAGFVEAVGQGVTLVEVGDHVVLSFAWCGRCDNCLRAHPASCREFRAENFLGSRPDGTSTVHRGAEVVHANFFGQSSLATHALVREQHLVKIDPDIPSAVAAPLGCGVQTGAGAVLNVLRPTPRDSFVVFGAGGVGLSALLAAKVAAASPTVVVEPLAVRRQLALELGASAALDPAQPGLADRLKEISRGGFSTALDTSGNVEVIRTGFEALSGQGQLATVAMSHPTAEVALPLAQILSGKQIRGVTEGDAVPRIFIPMLLRLWREGAFPMDRLCRTFGLHQIEEAVEAARSGEVVKPVLLP